MFILIANDATSPTGFSVAEIVTSDQYHPDVLRIADNAQVGDWWDDGTHVATPPPPQPAPTPEELQKQFTDAIQCHLDEFARTNNYDNIMSAATYATSTVPKFKAEGQYAVEARDLTWATGYQILDDVLFGVRPMPTFEDVLAELPLLVWPQVTP